MPPGVRGALGRRRRRGVAGGDLVDRVDDGALRWGHGAVEKWVLGPHHPIVQSSSQVLCDPGEGGVVDAVVPFGGVQPQVEECLTGRVDVAPPGLQKDVLGQAVVQVRQHPPGVLVVVAVHVLVPGGANGTLRFVGCVIGHLREDQVVDLGHVTADEREQRLALQPGRVLNAQHVADRRVEVEVAHQRVGDAATLETPGPRMSNMTPIPRSYIVHLASGKARPWSVVMNTRVLSASRLSSRALRTVPTPWSRDRALALNEAMSRRVCALSRTFSGGLEYRTSRMDDGSKNFSMGLEEADRQEERCVLLGPLGDELCGGWSDLADPRRIEVDDMVVTQVERIRGDVLLADQTGPVAGFAQHVDHVALGVAQPIAAVGQAEHPRRVRALAGQQGGP